MLCTLNMKGMLQIFNYVESLVQCTKKLKSLNKYNSLMKMHHIELKLQHVLERHFDRFIVTTTQEIKINMTSASDRVTHISTEFTAGRISGMFVQKIALHYSNSLSII